MEQAIIMDPQTRAEQQKPRVSYKRVKALVKKYKGQYINEITDLTEYEKEALLFHRIVQRYGDMNTIDFLVGKVKYPLTPEEAINDLHKKLL